MIGVIPNPSKRFQVAKPISEVSNAIEDIQHFASKYKLFKANRIINQFVFEASEFLSLGVYIDIETFAIGENVTDVSITIRRKLGSFDKSHEVTLANQHLETTTEWVAQLIEMGPETRAQRIQAARTQAAQAASAPAKKQKSNLWQWILLVVFLVALVFLARRANTTETSTVTPAAEEKWQPKEDTETKRLLELVNDSTPKPKRK